jgi:hypothetical protein
MTSWPGRIRRPVEARADVDAQLAAAREHVGGAVVVRLEEDAEAGRRLGQPVDLLLERDDLVAGVLERRHQTLVLRGHGREVGLQVGQPLLEHPHVTREIRPACGATR